MIGISAINVVNNASRIVRNIEVNSEQILVEFGQDVREIARDKMKPGDGPSPNGSAPNVHSPEPNMETILYAVNKVKKEVTAGPIKITGSLHANRPLPNVLEFGGTVRVVRRRRSRQKRRGRKVLKPRAIVMRYLSLIHI